MASLPIQPSTQSPLPKSKYQMLSLTHREKLAIQMMEHLINLEIDQKHSPANALGNAKLNFIRTMDAARKELQVSNLNSNKTLDSKLSDLTWEDVLSEVHADRFLACINTVFCSSTNTPLYRRYFRLTDLRYTSPIQAKWGWESGDPAYPDYRKTDVFMYTGVRLDMLEQRGKPAEMVCICEVELDETGREKQRWWIDPTDDVMQWRDGKFLDWIWRGQ